MPFSSSGRFGFGCLGVCAVGCVFGVSGVGFYAVLGDGLGYRVWVSWVLSVLGVMCGGVEHLERVGCCASLVTCQTDVVWCML